MKNDHTSKCETKRRISKSRAGTTLIEAILALSIFAAFTTGACKMMVMSRKTLDMAREQYTAANIAKNRLELIRTFDFDQIPTLSEKAILVDQNGVPNANGNFRRVTTITTMNDSLYKLAITVSVRNRETLTFRNSGQVINSYISNQLTKP